MFINQKILNFLIFFFCFNIFSSISQTNEDVPLNNIVQHESPKPISSVIFEDFLGNEVNLNDYKEFKLRGVPTTVLINKKNEEFARIIGSINFRDKKFLKWLSNYD